MAHVDGALQSLDNRAQQLESFRKEITDEMVKRGNQVMILESTSSGNASQVKTLGDGLRQLKLDVAKLASGLNASGLSSTGKPFIDSQAFNNLTYSGEANEYSSWLFQFRTRLIEHDPEYKRILDWIRSSKDELDEEAYDEWVVSNVGDNTFNETHAKLLCTSL